MLWLPIAKDNPETPADCYPYDCNLDDMNEQLELQANIKVDSIQSAYIFVEEKLNTIPWKEMTSSKEIKAIAIAHGAQNFGLYINLAWLPSYFNQRYGLSVSDSALSSVLPWVAGAVCGTLAGFGADYLLSKGIEKTKIRKISQTLALVLPAICLMSLSIFKDGMTSEVAITYFVAACAFASICVAGFGSSVQDICQNPKLTSTVYGLTSVPAVLFGSLGVYATGVVLDTTNQSWELVFQGTAVVYILGAIYYNMNYEAKKLF